MNSKRSTVSEASPVFEERSCQLQIGSQPVSNAVSGTVSKQSRYDRATYPGYSANSMTSSFSQLTSTLLSRVK
jgi:hypothetical protein